MPVPHWVATYSNERDVAAEVGKSTEKNITYTLFIKYNDEFKAADRVVEFCMTFNRPTLQDIIRAMGLIEYINQCTVPGYSASYLKLT